MSKLFQVSPSEVGTTGHTKTTTIQEVAEFRSSSGAKHVVFIPTVASAENNSVVNCWPKLIGHYVITKKNHENALLLKVLKLQLFGEGI